MTAVSHVPQPDWTCDTDRELAWVALCVWEAMRDDPGPWQQWRADNGMSEARYAAIHLAVHAERLWRSIDTEAQEAEVFDWEWLPMWLRTAVDWSNTNTQPRVLT